MQLLFTENFISSDQPLVVMVHGRGGNHTVMSAFKRCIPENFNLVFPQAPEADPLIGGFSWWDINKRETLLETALAQARNLKNFITNYQQSKNITNPKILACGFSQGSAVLSIILQLNPELFSGLAILSGLVLEYPDLAKPALNTDIFMAHGTLDDTITIEKAKRSKNYLESLGYKVNFQTEDVAHKVGAKSMAELKSWLTK